TSRSFWRYWVSAIGKFIPKSGAECRFQDCPIVVTVKRRILFTHADGLLVAIISMQERIGGLAKSSSL
ncbi:hypothetical protein, partial [Aeromonas caviae]|uniref:hypothetical protein n=1 Tax=Aeromonas caviae TaxID=648 RepID=UPI002B458F5C